MRRMLLIELTDFILPSGEVLKHWTPEVIAIGGEYWELTTA